MIGQNHTKILKKLFICLIVLVICATVSIELWLNCLVTRYASVYHHAVVIDAWSPESRLFAYKFRVRFSVFGQANLELVDEFFEQSDPGSSYVDDPEQVAFAIVQLVEADFLTPPEKRESTLLIVRVTQSAGFQLLPKILQDLNTSVSTALSKFPYDTKTYPGVEIMDETHERIYSWYTFYVLNMMYGVSTVSLNLDDNATHITYRLEERDLPHYPATDKYIVQAGRNDTIYTHSYDGLGLLTARYSVFSKAGEDLGINAFRSVCVSPYIQHEPWIFRNIKYYISGAERPIGMTPKEAFDLCHAVVKQYVVATLDWAPSMPPGGTVVVTGSFYDVTAGAGMIEAIPDTYRVFVAEYKTAALKQCSSTISTNPWNCIDLVYVLTLLQDAYKMQPSKLIKVFKRMNDHEVTWSLGLAYTSVMNKMTHQ